MSDSLCGPSNALQNFQKQSTVDRTLQQDRLVNRQSPSQGFRSAGPNAGVLDQEFEAFQRGNLPLESHQGFQQPHHQPFQPGPSSWASDFQRMNISGSPLPQIPQQSQFHTPQKQQNIAGWHQEFAQMQGGEQRIANGSPSQVGISRPSGFQYGGMGMQPQYGMQYGGGMMRQTAQVPVQQAPVFDEEAFTRAFDEAAQAEIVETSQDQATDEVLLEQSAERFMDDTIPAEEQIPNQPKIGADIIHDPIDQILDTPAEEDPDAIAKTAGHLLKTVKNNTTDKFINSEFLQLMRQFRDREVIVDGEEIVGTGQDIKQSSTQIKSWLHELKRLALDQDRPLSRANREGIRDVLLALVQLSLISPSAAEQTGSDFAQVRRILQAMIDSQNMLAFPALRDLAQSLLSTKYSLDDIPHMIDSMGVGAVTRVLEGYEAVDVNVAVREFISSSLASNGVATHATSQRFYLLLGYMFPSPNIPLHMDHIHDTHIRRVRELLGPSILETMRACRAFWCSSLRPEEVFSLVGLHEQSGDLGAASLAFRERFREVEGVVEERLARERWGFGGDGGEGVSIGRVMEVREWQRRIVSSREQREREVNDIDMRDLAEEEVGIVKGGREGKRDGGRRWSWEK